MRWDLLSATGRNGRRYLLYLRKINPIILHCLIICGHRGLLFVLWSAVRIIIGQFTRRLRINTFFLVLSYLFMWFKFLNHRCRQVFLIKRIMLLGGIDAYLCIILLSLKSWSLSLGFSSSRRDTLYPIILNQRIICVYYEIFLMIDSWFWQLVNIWRSLFPLLDNLSDQFILSLDCSLSVRDLLLKFTKLINIWILIWKDSRVMLLLLLELLSTLLLS